MPIVTPGRRHRCRSPSRAAAEAATTGIPGGAIGTRHSAIAAPSSALDPRHAQVHLVDEQGEVESGNIASSPAPRSPISDPPRAPIAVPATSRPLRDRRAEHHLPVESPRRPRRASAHDASIIACASTAAPDRAAAQGRRHRQPIGRKRVVDRAGRPTPPTRRPAAASTVTDPNCAAPANTKIDIRIAAVEPITGSASTPNEAPQRKRRDSECQPGLSLLHLRHQYRRMQFDGVRPEPGGRAPAPGGVVPAACSDSSTPSTWRTAQTTSPTRRPGWLTDAGLLTRWDCAVADHARALALREAIRDLAGDHTDGRAAAAINEAARRARLHPVLSDERLTARTGGDRRRRRPRPDRRRSPRGGRRGHVGAPEDLRSRQLPLGLLRPLEEPVEPLVLDSRLRRA